MEKTKLVRTFGTALATATLSFGLFVPTAVAAEEIKATGSAVEIKGDVDDGVAQEGEDVLVTIPTSLGKMDKVSDQYSTMTFKGSDGTVDQEYVLKFKDLGVREVKPDDNQLGAGFFAFSYKTDANDQAIVDKIVAKITVTDDFVNGTWKLDEIELKDKNNKELATVTSDVSFKVTDNDDHVAPAKVDLERIIVKKEVHHNNPNSLFVAVDPQANNLDNAEVEVVYTNPAGAKQKYTRDDGNAFIQQMGRSQLFINVPALDTEVDGYYSLESITIKFACPHTMDDGRTTANLYDAITYDDMAILSDGDYTVSGLGVEAMLRLYNPYTGEHIYTNDTLEAAAAEAAGWTFEGLAWYAPVSGYYPGSLAPVYRVYNQYNGEHHYTTSAEEVLTLVAAGWTDEGVGFYTTNKGDTKAQAIYRLFNPFATVGTHHYTVGAEERDAMIDAGWKNEGVGWYGVKVRDLD